MQIQPVHQCQCSECQQAGLGPTRELHQRMNFLVSTLDERQRRLYIGLESHKLGYGGDRRLAQITGLSVDTIAQGRSEIEQMEPQAHIRAPGAGRPRVEKKTRPF